MTSVTAPPMRENSPTAELNTIDDRKREKYLSFSQEIPTKEEFAAYTPPPLPPHLAKVLEDWPSDEEHYSHPETQTGPLLLNHLFLLQISDDVLIQSTTIRIGEKLTTTVFYKSV
ncbi:5'-AMP-activated protein kinase, beta subunit, complex-interacting region [Ancylostoma caninum]|uniref:5'-AMP-activated protein kinase, beta subunit, complex-interacting region n=1 Tax=Ancylostoma caninum TaxID=29170 RepID=A0A368HA79_ANCCA|nr:5'-AMP-activated protein kinase, beta subunit, complex-interacting region [Ancylostoma caninum]